MKVKLFIGIFAGLLLLIFVGCGSVVAVYPAVYTTETVSQTIKITETVTMENVTTKTISETICVTEYIQILNQFESYEELSSWLESVKSEMRTARQTDWICQDFSWWLVNRAQKDGFLMIFHGIKPEAYNSCFTNLQLDGAHAITATYINGHTYLIEPQNMEVFPSYNIQ